MVDFVNVGASANDRTGDTLRAAFRKMNSFVAPIKVGAIGDSNTALGVTVSSSTNYFNQQGWVCHFRQLSGQRFDFPASRVWATGGLTSQQIIDTWLPTAVAAGTSGDCQLCFVLAGTNDLPDDAITAAMTIANLNTIIDALRAVGVIVVLQPLPPRDNNMTATRYKKRAEINRWIALRAFDPRGIIVPNGIYGVQDATSANGGFLTNRSYDTLHFTVAGAGIWGQANADAVAALLPPAFNSFNNVADTYNATTNPTGSLMDNGMMNGTGGAATATGSSGVFADNWRIQDSTSPASIGTLAFVGSKTARTDGANDNRQTITVSGTPTADYTVQFAMGTPALSSGFSTGDTFVMRAEITIESGATGVLNAGVQVVYATGGSNTMISRDGLFFSNATKAFTTMLIPTTKLRVCQTDPYTIPAGITTITPLISLSFASGVAASAVIHIDRIEFRKVSV